MSRGKGSGKYSKVLRFRVTEDIMEKLLSYSEQHKISVSEVVRRALMVFFYQKSLKKR